MCHFQSENVFQIPVMLQGKTIFYIQAMILLKNQRSDENSLSKSTSSGTHTELNSVQTETLQ